MVRTARGLVTIETTIRCQIYIIS